MQIQLNTHYEYTYFDKYSILSTHILTSTDFGTAFLVSKHFKNKKKIFCQVPFLFTLE